MIKSCMKVVKFRFTSQLSFTFNCKKLKHFIRKHITPYELFFYNTKPHCNLSSLHPQPNHQETHLQIQGRQVGKGTVLLLKRMPVQFEDTHQLPAYMMCYNDLPKSNLKTGKI